MIPFGDYLLRFTDIPQASLKALLDLFVPNELSKNHLYVQEGKKAKKLAFLQEGLMRAYYQNDEGEDFNKIFFQNPSIVGGYSSLITKSPSNINIDCLTDCKILEADFQDIVDLYGEHRSIETLNRKIAEDFFVQKEFREMSLVMYDASKRYALFGEKFPELVNNVPLYHIASYLGISAVQLSRIRGKKD